jgi:hypothetical protein
MFTFSSGLYPEELFYGFVGRNLSFESKEVDDWVLDVLKLKNRTPSIQFSSYLNRFVNIIPTSFHYSNEFILQHSTILPIFAPFISESRKTLVINKMVGDNPSGLYELLGIPGGHLFNIKKSLRYCPLCVEHDLQEYDEAYFHKIHHVDGVIVCPEHGCLVEEYANIDNLPFVNRFHIINSDNLGLSPRQISSRHIRESLIHIAKEANILMNLNLYNYNIESTKEKYFNLLKEKEFVTHIGHIRIKELSFQFKQYYSDDLLSKLNCNFKLDNSQNWIRSFFGYKNVMLHPMRHILLINFLCDGVLSFFNNNNSYNYFGDGPWLCLNPVAQHYGQPVVQDLRITEEYKTKRPLGVFTCACGFIYTRRGPDKNPDDKYRIGRIRQYGQVWESKLRELILGQNLSLRAISSALKCGSETVVKYGRKLNLDQYISSNILLTSVPSRQKHKSDYKKTYEERVIQCISENPNCNKKKIKEKLPKEFLWLEKYDLDWLNQNVPIQNNYSKVKGKCKANWVEIDKTTLNALLDAYQEIMLYSKPVRVTKTLLGHVSGRLYYVKSKIDILPQSKTFMMNVVETFEQFKARLDKIRAITD